MEARDGHDVVEAHSHMHEALELCKLLLQSLEDKHHALSLRIFLAACRIYRSLYERTGSFQILEQLLRYHHRASITWAAVHRAGTSDDQQYSQHEVYLADHLLDYYHETGEKESMEQAVKLLRGVLIRSPDHPSALLSLCDHLVEAHVLTWDVNLLEEAHELVQRARKYIPATHGLSSRLCLSLASFYSARYQLKAQYPDASYAQKLYTDVLNMNPSPRIECYCKMGMIQLQDSLSQIESDDKRNKVLDDPLRMLSRMSDDLHHLPRYFRMEICVLRAYELRTSVEKERNDADPRQTIQAAIEICQKVLDICSSLHPVRPKALYELCSAFKIYAQLTQDKEYLSLQRSHSDAGMLDYGNIPRYSHYFMFLRATVRSSTSTLHEYGESVDLARKNLSLCPESSLFYMRSLQCLQWSLGTYYNTTGNTACLDELILYSQQAVERGQSGNIAMLGNLAMAFSLRARSHATKAKQRLLICRVIDMLKPLNDKELVGLDKSIYLSGLLEACDLDEECGLDTPNIPDAAERLHLARELHNLGIQHYEHSEIGRENLIAALLAYSVKLDDVEPLREATQLIQSALLASSTQGTSAELLRRRAHWVTFEGEALALSSRMSRGRSGAIEDSGVALGWSKIRDAIRTPGLNPLYALEISKRWARLAEKLDDTNAALEAYTTAVDLLPRIAYLGQDVIGRLQALRHAQDVSTRAATYALSRGQVPRAINLLEQARGVLWSQSLHLRATLDWLPDSQASRLLQLSTKVEKSNDFSSSEGEFAAIALEDLITDIRLNPEYHHFLQPQQLDIENFCANLIPSKEFAVMVIPGARGCNVVIFGVAGSPYMHIHYPEINEDHLLKMAHRFSTETSHVRNAITGADSERKIQLIPGADETAPYEVHLEELWNIFVYRIIKALRVSRTSASNRPRLWWCIAGALTCLPFHAAGVYTGDHPDNLSNYVVSSYTPTLMSLRRSQDDVKLSGSTSFPDKVLMLAQSSVSDLPALEKAENELSVIRHVVGADLVFDLSTGATETIHGNLLAHLKEASVLHLACHAAQDRNDPLQSGFMLESGCLTLEQLMRARAPHAKLAYLSACESAAMDENQPDEVINLAATMLFVGFKSVIATMWSMNDLDGPFMAERIYRSIFKAGELDLAAIPYALDDAVRQLRESGVHASRWATYVHIGV